MEVYVAEGSSLLSNKQRCKKGIGYTQLARFSFQTVCTLRPHLGMDSDSEEADSSFVDQIFVFSHVMEMCFFIWRQKMDAIDKNSVSFCQTKVYCHVI